MWIMISVLMTCIILIIINVMMSIRDSKFKRDFENNFDSKVKYLMSNDLRLNEDIDKLKLNNVDIKNEIMQIHQILMDIKVDSSTDSLTFNKRFRDIDVKVDLALMSIKNIQDSYLNKEYYSNELNIGDDLVE